MISRSRFALLVVCCLGLTAPASAQVVRFETTMGNFDMVLNPTNNPVLQGHVDNMLEYVNGNKYLGSWINRADTGFVLQMGGFFSHTKRPPPTIDSIHSVQSFAPIQGEPAAENPGLSNTVGTVSLALSGLASGGTNQNSGSSSFFVNLTSNTFLDQDFTVFAAIPDMTTVNAIMALSTIDRTQEPDFGAGSGNLGFAKVPVMDNGFQVFVKRAFVISDTLTAAKDMAAVESVVQSSLAAATSATAGLPPATTADASAFSSSGSAAGSGGLSPASSSVPEPTSGLLAGIAVAALGFLRRRGR